MPRVVALGLPPWTLNGGPRLRGTRLPSGGKNLDLWSRIPLSPSSPNRLVKRRLFAPHREGNAPHWVSQNAPCLLMIIARIKCRVDVKRRQNVRARRKNLYLESPDSGASLHPSPFSLRDSSIPAFVSNPPKISVCSNRGDLDGSSAEMRKVRKLQSFYCAMYRSMNKIDCISHGIRNKKELSGR